MKRLRFQITRDADGWHVYSPEFTFESLLRCFPTRRAAITDVQNMKHDEEWSALADALNGCDDDE